MMKIFGFAGWSGSGKTTLIEHLIPRLVARAGTVSLVKHAHHEFDLDQPGKDSWRHRQAGCTEVLVSSSQRFALLHELRGAPELTLPQALARLSPDALVLIEGYKSFPMPKLEVWREKVGKPLLYTGDTNIRGLATDTPEAFAGASFPVFQLTDVDEIATFVLREATAWPFPIDEHKSAE